MNINKVILAGNITKDLELKMTPNGVGILQFTLAINRSWKDKDGQKQEQTEFSNCVIFGKQAETLSTYAVKGQNLLVEGRLQTDKWEKEGQTHYSTKIIVESFQFGDKPNSVRAENKIEDKMEVETSGLDIEDIPF